MKQHLKTKVLNDKALRISASSSRQLEFEFTDGGRVSEALVKENKNY